MDKIDNELNDDYKKYGIRNLSPQLIGRISSLSRSLKPYRYLKREELTKAQLSPERGQLLLSLLTSELDTLTLKSIFKNSNFSFSELTGVTFENTYMKNINLSNSTLENSNFYNAQLQKSNLESINFINTNFWHANLNNANLKNSSINNSTIRISDFSDAEISDTSIMNNQFINDNFKPKYLNSNTFKLKKTNDKTFDLKTICKKHILEKTKEIKELNDQLKVLGIHEGDDLIFQTEQENCIWIIKVNEGVVPKVVVEIDYEQEFIYIYNLSTNSDSKKTLTNRTKLMEKCFCSDLITIANNR